MSVGFHAALSLIIWSFFRCLRSDVAHAFNNISNNYREEGTGRGLHASLKSVNFDGNLTWARLRGGEQRGGEKGRIIDGRSAVYAKRGRVARGML